tara:strand:+ start:610 stop:1044 length:435 start_codon:yes stop_codon:yes gene_type:complete
MKAKTFENLIRRIVREEIDYALHREIKTLKEDLQNITKPIITEQPTVNTPVPDNKKNSLREKIMGKNPIKQNVNQNFSNDKTLNALLNETAQGDTNTQTAMAPATDPFSTSGIIPTETMPESVANVVTRDYRSLMQAIDNKKGK